MFAKALSITLLSLLSIPMALAAPTPGVPDLTVTLTDVNGVETVYASETSPSAELPGTILLNREGTPGALYFSCTPLEKSTVLSNVNAAFFGGGDCRFFVSNDCSRKTPTDMISYTRYLGSKYLNVIYGDPAVHFPWSDVVTQGVGSFMCAAGDDKLPSYVDYVPGEQLA